MHLDSHCLNSESHLTHQAFNKAAMLGLFHGHPQNRQPFVHARACVCVCVCVCGCVQVRPGLIKTQLYSLPIGPTKPSAFVLSLGSRTCLTCMSDRHSLFFSTCRASRTTVAEGRQQQEHTSVALSPPPPPPPPLC